jgi:hypothetical protein
VRALAAIAAVALGAGAAPTSALADEGGVSFWIPGFFGSLAATPMQPGWTVSTIYYHTSVSAGGDVALAREFEIGKVPLNLSANLSANLNATADLVLATATYTVKEPVLGNGQLALTLLGVYGQTHATLDGTLTGALTTPLGTIPFMRSDSISDTATGFGDLLPILAVRWNKGVHNYLWYVTGDIPVGLYSATSLANIGIGHGTIDSGVGYTYFNPQTGNEFSAVLGFTYNFTNPSTLYQSGVDMHLDWGTSHFLTKQFLVGLVGYVYKEIGCDSGTGDHVGCFQSQVIGVGPQAGFIFPVGDLQGYINLKGYREFANQDRPDGWNVWATFVISPAPPTSTATPRRMVTK